MRAVLALAPPAGLIAHSCCITGDVPLLNSILRTAAYLPVLWRTWLRLTIPLFPERCTASELITVLVR